MEKKKLGTSLFLSVLTHFFIFASLIFLALFAAKEISENEKEGGDWAVWVDLEPIGKGLERDGSAEQERLPPPKSSGNKKEGNAAVPSKSQLNYDAEKSRQNEKTQEGNGSQETVNSSERGGAAGGKGEGKSAGTGAGNGTASPSVLGVIRRKIEQAKRYPALARARKIEGVTVLSFSIHPSGAVDSLSLVKSSGSEILDQEALATVKRAAPLPYYSQPIRISINFSLE